MSRWSLIAALVCVVMLWMALAFDSRADSIAANAPRFQRDFTRSVRSVWGIDGPLADLAAQAHQESRWRVDAQSPVGARGISQFMPATAAWINGIFPSLTQNPTYSPAWSFRAMALYDQWLWQRVTARSHCDRMAMTLSAYNGGLGWVYKDQRLAAAKGADSARWWYSVERFNAGRSAAAFAENRGYPQLILKRFAPLYASAGWGLSYCKPL